MWCAGVVRCHLVWAVWCRVWIDVVYGVVLCWVGVWCSVVLGWLGCRVGWCGVWCHLVWAGWCKVWVDVGWGEVRWGGLCRTHV